MTDELQQPEAQEGGMSKKERRELRRQEKLNEQSRDARGKTVKKYTRLIIALVIVAALVGSIAWVIVKQPTPAPGSDSEIISRAGIHWHPEIKIFIKGKEEKIPQGVGLAGVERPIHTHDDTGVIHLEFSGLVTVNDTRIKEFFKIWGKRFDSQCIFDKCNGLDGTVKMTVNGKENTEFENYVMHDADKIEIRYE